MANTLKFGNGQWATGTGTALAYNDENANYKPLPFDFTRASSGTTVNQSGLIETVGSGTPRIDFEGNTKGALLLEPSRTNLITYSQDFSQGWNLSSATITSNSIISPDGLVNATTLDISAFGGGLADSFSVSNGNVTFSLFVKKGTTNGIRLRIDASTDSNGFFDLVNNTVYSSTDNASIESYGNDWYKVSISANITSFSKVAIYGTNGSDSYQNGNVYVYGAQLEEGSYATSYIPTSGSAVTRVADACNNGGNDQVINSTEGVLYADIAALEIAGTVNQRAITLSGNSTNKVMLRFTLNKIQVFIIYGGSLVSNLFSPTLTDIKSFNKVAFKYKSSGDNALWVNGTEVATSNDSFTFTSNLNLLKFNEDGSSDFLGKTKDVRVYNEALTDAQLTVLTTL